MRAVFADTSFFVAFVNPADDNHAAAVEFRKTYRGQILTTRWVLAEFGNFLAGTPARRLYAPFVRELVADPQTRLIGRERALFDTAIALYARRADKHWSMVDCTSFAAMRQRNVVHALTADHHFEQAGFIALLKT